MAAGAAGAGGVVSAEYEPGTVAVATVRGEPNVRVMRRDDRIWMAPTTISGANVHHDHEVTDVRPLVVLDLDETDREVLPKWLRRNADLDGLARDVARQVEEQVTAQDRARYPKPEEPSGLGAVVKDRAGTRWVRRCTCHLDPARDWSPCGEDRLHRYDEIDAVEVLSKGVPS